MVNFQPVLKPDSYIPEAQPRPTSTQHSPLSSPSYRTPTEPVQFVQNPTPFYRPQSGHTQFSNTPVIQEGQPTQATQQQYLPQPTLWVSGLVRKNCPIRTLYTGNSVLIGCFVESKTLLFAYSGVQRILYFFVASFSGLSIAPSMFS